MRIRFVKFAVGFVLLFLGLSLFNLQIVQGKKFRELSNKNCIRLLPQMGARGKILDRNGNVIVDNRLSYDLMIMPQEEISLNEVMLGVAQILGTSFTALKDKFQRDSGTPFLPVTLAKNIDIKKVLALEELKPDLSGIIIQASTQRVYPYARLACHLLGYLNEIDLWRMRKLTGYGYKHKDIVGFGGVEEKYDYYLRQDEGGLSVEVDHRGRFVRLLGFKPPISGKNIQLTLDLKLQKLVEESLAERKGAIIIMEPYRGELIALASSPNFNPTVFMRKDTSAINSLLRNPDAPLINRGISGVYPAGSVFKLILATAALDTGKINSAKTFFCPGSLHLGKEEFLCWDTHQQQNLSAAIIHSCNVFFYRTGLLIGPQLIHDYALKFGLAKPALIDLPYASGGLVPSPLWRRIYKFRNWFDGDTVNLAIGQGELLVTPLQLVRMMAVFANKGILVNPYLVKTIDSRDVSIYKKKAARLPLKESTVDYMRQALRNVVSEPTGTANVLSGSPVAVAGKTGTAQTSRSQPHAWFLGFFPFKNPKFVICVFLEHGGSAQAACILTKQIIEAMVKEGLI